MSEEIKQKLISEIEKVIENFHSFKFESDIMMKSGACKEELKVDAEFLSTSFKELVDSLTETLTILKDLPSNITNFSQIEKSVLLLKEMLSSCRTKIEEENKRIYKI